MSRARGALVLPALAGLVSAFVPSRALAGDVFITQREVFLREAPAAGSKIRARLPGGARAERIGETAGFYEIRLDGPLPARLGSEPPCPRGETGWIARETAAVFGGGDDDSRQMIAVGRFLAPDPARRPLAAALLIRGLERLRASGSADPASAVALGETAETLATGDLPVPPGLAYAMRTDHDGAVTRWIYDGAAFRDALATTPVEDEAWRDRARAGVLRAAFPFTGNGLVALWQEASAFFELQAGARDTDALDFASRRLASASLALGRLLLAAGKTDELSGLASRVGEAAERTAGTSVGGGDLRSSVALLGAMKGNGTPPFPQEAAWGVGPAPLQVRIAGEIGDLALTMRIGDVPAALARRSIATPILPVPGSLRVSPDGRSAAWLEVASPTRITPVVVRLDGRDSGVDLTLVSGGRPTRDRRRRYVLTQLLDFSRDGQRLGVAIRAWDESPSGAPRLSVITLATGEVRADESARSKNGRGWYKKRLG